MFPESTMAWTPCSTYIRSHVPKLVVDPPDLVIEGGDPALEVDEGWWIITATKIR